MNINVIKAYILKEFKELFRSRLIIMVYVMPTMLLILFGYGMKLDVTHARLIILDKDQSQSSIILSSKFEHSKYFNTKVLHISENEALRRIKQAKADAILIIPSSFEKNILKEQKSELGVFVDASFPMRGSTIESYIKGTIFSFVNEVSTSMGIKHAGEIKINSRSLFNQAMRDKNAIVPGIIGLALLIAPAILSALLIVKEKEEGTIFNFYSSPVSKFDFLISKIFPIFLVHSVNIFILWLISVYLFKVPFRGSFFLYWLSSEIYILVSISIGALISVVTKKQIVAIVLTLLVTVIPGFLYSGIMMPISSMSGESKIEAHIFPIMYYNHIVYDTFLIGQGFHSDKILLYLGILVAFVIVLFGSGFLLLKKRLTK